MLDDDLSWLSAAAEVEAVNAGWATNGGTTGPAITAGEFRPSTSGGPDAYVVRRVHPSDPLRGRQRRADRIELQVQIRVLSRAPSWTGLGVHGLFIDDGFRALALLVGPSLELADPYTGSVVAIVRESWAWQATGSLLLVKEGSERWEVWGPDGSLLLAIGYDAAPASSSISVNLAGVTRVWNSARVGWGRLDTSGAGDARFDAIEHGLNLSVPRAWKVQRLQAAMPAPIRSRWNARWEAVARTIAGMAQLLTTALDRAWPQSTQGVLVAETIGFTGEILPWVEDVRWAIVGPDTDFSVVSERIRIAGSDVPTAVQYTIEATSAVEIRAVVTFVVQLSTSYDREGRIGPCVQIRNGTRRVTASLLWSEASQTYGWALHDGDVSNGDLGAFVGRFWPVNPYRDHVVEVRVIRDDRVVLYVDDVLVDDVPASGFAFLTATRNVTIGKGDGVDIAVVCAMSRAVVEIRHTDQGPRPGFLIRSAEKLVFVGGRERNDRLGAWGSYVRELHGQRGTEGGLLDELRRIAGDDTLQLRKRADPAGWFVDRTFPGITPVFLDADGLLTDVVIEFPARIPNYPAEDFARLVRRYLAPVSLVEAEIRCAVIAQLTTTPVQTTVSTFEVAATTGFAAGDAVELREELHGAQAVIDYTDARALAGADVAWVAVELERSTSGRFEIHAQGLGELEYLGEFTSTGRTGDRDGVMPGNGTVTVTGAGAAVDARVWVIGRDAGGLVQFEAFRALGTTPDVGALVFSVVYGALASTGQPAAINVTSTAGAVALYTIDVGNPAVGGGCLSFVPGLLIAPAKITVVADAATTDPLILAGIDDDADEFALELVTLAGTTPVESTRSWRELRAVPLGYVAAARTLTFRANASDRTAVARIVSTSASDVQTGWWVGYDDADEAVIERFTMNGTTPVTGSRTWQRLPGVRLSAPAVGVVTVTQVNSTVPTPVTVVLHRIAAGQSSSGFHLRQIPVSGNVRLKLNQPQSEARRVIVVGYDAITGDLAGECLLLEGTDYVDGDRDWLRLEGLVTGHVPNTKYVVLAGDSWLSPTLLDTVRTIDEFTSWALSGLLDDQAVLDYLAPARGAETGLRDQKSERHSTAVAGWPVHFHTGKTGAGLAESVVGSSTAGAPIVVQLPTLADRFAYNLTGASLTAWIALWATGTLTVFFRFRRTVNNGGGVYHVIKASAGTSTTSEQVGLNAGTTTLRFRHNGVDNNQIRGAIALNTWYSAAVVLTAGSSQWYSDGVALGGAVAHGGPAVADLFNAFRNIGTTDGIDLADLAIYRRALTGPEVVALVADTDGDGLLRRDASLWAHYLDPHRTVPTAWIGGPVTLEGRRDVVEATSITTLDAETGVITTTPPVTGFTDAAVLRRFLE